MKKQFFCFVLAWCLLTNAYGVETGMRWSLQGESMEDGSTASLGFFSEAEGMVYGGVSINYIDSSSVIQHSNRKIIYPVYFVLGVKAPWVVSPFLELGMDLPEMIFDELFNNENVNENEIDYFFSAGAEIQINEEISVSFYAKRYNFYFREDIFNSPLIKNRQNSYGVGIIRRF